jgi:hypothetical protein
MTLNVAGIRRRPNDGQSAFTVSISACDSPIT